MGITYLLACKRVNPTKKLKDCGAASSNTTINAAVAVTTPNHPAQHINLNKHIFIDFTFLY